MQGANHVLRLFDQRLCLANRRPSQPYCGIVGLDFSSPTLHASRLFINLRSASYAPLCKRWLV